MEMMPSVHPSMAGERGDRATTPVRRIFRDHRLLIVDIRRQRPARRWDDESFFSLARRCDQMDGLKDRPARFLSTLIGAEGIPVEDWWSAAEMAHLACGDPGEDGTMSLVADGTFVLPSARSA